MICPHCHGSIDDGLDVCPECGEAISGEDVVPGPSFVFCEGCGARLSPHDRTCPKCGRPAPGILSSEDSAKDLAAGKTASFPRLTVGLDDDPASRPSGPSAASVLDLSLDPESTHILDLSDMDAASSKKGRRRRRAKAPVDPYHDDKRPYLRIALAAVVAALVVGGALFVYHDPLGVMPGIYEAVDKSASEMFPSRYQVSTTEPAASVEGSSDAGDDGVQHDVSSDLVEITDDSVLADAQAYDVLLAKWKEIGDFEDTLSDVIDDYNGSYVASDLSRRQEASQSAYAMRDQVQQTINSLDAIELSHDSVYAETLDHLKQLATWMYNRVDVLCESWDISLSIPEGERASDHQSDITAPLRSELDSKGRNVNLVKYEEHYSEWKPRELA